MMAYPSTITEAVMRDLWSRSRRLIRYLLSLGLLTAVTGCTAPTISAEDPLVDRIFRSRDVTEISRESLLEEFDQAQVIYLGEKHDNPKHHELQLGLVRTLVERGRRPSIGFEFFSLDQTSLLMSFVTSKGSSKINSHGFDAESRLKKALGWEGDDERWEYYAPILRLARDHQLNTFGTDLPRGLRRRITRVGTDGLTAVEQALLYPTGFDDPVYEALMNEIFKRSHCGYGDPDYIGRLYANWVARNDAIAMSVVEMLNQQGREPVVVILGAGHVQYNMGVYERVAHKQPDVRQINLGFREVANEQVPANAYMRSIELDGRRFAPDHEYFWFSGRVETDEEDRCERFRRHIKKVEKNTVP